MKQFERTHEDRFPRYSGRADEQRLYYWLQRKSDTTSNTSKTYTHERANKPVLAFHECWQSECFPDAIIRKIRKFVSCVSHTRRSSVCVCRAAVN